MQGALIVLFSCFVVLCASQGPVCDGANEQRQCVSSCPPERTCANRFIGFSCAAESPKICKLACRCNPGYIRNDNGDCIPEDGCGDSPRFARSVQQGTKKCTLPNEFFDCGPECDNVCSELHYQNRTNCPIQNIVCNPKCYCRDGFARDGKGNCVPVHQCNNPGLKHKRQVSSAPQDNTGSRPKPYVPQVKNCTRPNEFYQCGPACDNVCATLHKQSRTNCPIRNIMCNSKCYCNDGYARDENWDCIPIEKCNNPHLRQKRSPRPLGIKGVCVGPNEEYACKTTCPPETCISIVAKYACNPKQKCESRCFCKPGYLRSYDNICVPICQCPEMKNSPECH